MNECINRRHHDLLPVRREIWQRLGSGFGSAGLGAKMARIVHQGSLVRSAVRITHDSGEWGK